MSVPDGETRTFDREGDDHLQCPRNRDMDLLLSSMLDRSLEGIGKTNRGTWT
jgi:hypothetical protein